MICSIIKAKKKMTFNFYHPLVVLVLFFSISSLFCLMITFPYTDTLILAKQTIAKKLSSGIMLFVKDSNNALIRTNQDDWIILLVNKTLFVISENKTENVNFFCDTGQDALLINSKTGYLEYVCIEPIKDVISSFDNIEHFYFIPYPLKLEHNYNVIDVINFIASEKKYISI